MTTIKTETITTRASLVLVRSQSATRVLGLDGENRFALVDHHTVGRSRSCEVSILAEIGGHKTFWVGRDEQGWFWQVCNEWACVTIASVEHRYDQPSIHAQLRLTHGDLIDVHHVHTHDVVCTFRFEQGEPPSTLVEPQGSPE